MATTKKALLIEYELEFLESKLDELKQYIEANPFSTLTDRMAWKETKGGGAIPICIANKEAQRKDLTQALKDYAEICDSFAHDINWNIDDVFSIKE